MIHTDRPPYFTSIFYQIMIEYHCLLEGCESALLFLINPPDNLSAPSVLVYRSKELPVPDGMYLLLLSLPLLNCQTLSRSRPGHIQVPGFSGCSVFYHRLSISQFIPRFLPFRLLFNTRSVQHIFNRKPVKTAVFPSAYRFTVFIPAITADHAEIPISKCIHSSLPSFPIFFRIYWILPIVSAVFPVPPLRLLPCIL